MIELRKYEAKTELSRLINTVFEGEKVIIVKSSHPVARLVPWEKAQIVRPLRWGGSEGTWMADDFVESK
jgi:prevent-host-death family protein